ncbi:hypothetical protein LUZ63_005288 [Rhynchospora breviuscula]|uniref:HAT C-terminal dimerisation domain-containing protein n=1 Tax=Rhynchospora breviuscula TaxID=2022672 RepID=A0A9Q0HSD6_9POAL|nr:hypothetical protein LUZ63_005288 [Rhynchospora breviuscula]
MGAGLNFESPEEIQNIEAAAHNEENPQQDGDKAPESNVPYKRPAWDVPTRWNSTYLMLELALELKPVICRYVNLDKRYTLNPEEYEWETVNALVVELKVFYDATLKLSGTKYPTLNLFYTEFSEVYLTIKRMASSAYPFIVQMGAQMLVKFDNCDDFMNNLRHCLNALFKEYEESNATSNHNQASSSMSKRQKRDASTSTTTNTKAALKDYIKANKNYEPAKSELDDYLGQELDSNDVDEEFDILAWWKLKVAKYLILSQLTRDVLAVPISTVASESAFSMSGRVLSPVRNSLNDESVEALLCAQDWLRASISEKGENFGDPLWAIDEGCGNEE